MSRNTMRAHEEELQQKRFYTSKHPVCRDKLNLGWFIYILGSFLNKNYSLALFGYDMINANSALQAPLAVYHLISNADSWNNL